ncbi:MAG: DMT family transporter [Desulfurococcales archaeon]|nr:DMT family transporter [Desulfurococcales archaeon]
MSGLEAGHGKYKGVTALVLTSLLWGTSFPVIKVVVTDVSEFTYTWLRSLVAVAGLLPYLMYYLRRHGSLSSETVKGGLLAGLAYALGLWLQGWGTRYTTASNSAFITGLNVVFVHLYVGVVKKSYSPYLGLALAFSVAGLYMITAPSTGFNVGDFLVLLSSVLWAAQVILVSRYCRGDPIIFTLFEMLPAVSFIVPDLISGSVGPIRCDLLLLIAYLGLVCSDAAFTLQVLGQRYVSAAVAAIIFLLEPVFAAVFAHLLISEFMSMQQVIGATLILAAMLVASVKS